MKKYLAVVLLATLFTAACAKKTDSARTIVKPSATAGQSAADQQAAAVGLNIDWQKTDIVDFGDTSITLEHTFTLNGASQTAKQTISTLTVMCDNKAGLQYDTTMVNSPDAKVTTAIGYTGCWQGEHFNVGLSFMAWSANQYLTQQFIAINASEGQLNQLQKLVSSMTSGIHLPDWFSAQFSSY